LDADPVALIQQLHDEHAAALWGYCVRLTGHDRARAEDVVQETLLRAWRHFSVLDESQGSVRAWLFTVARNIVIDDWRSRRARGETTLSALPELGETVDRTDEHSPSSAPSTARCCRSATTGEPPCRRPRVVSECRRER
jgi:RNA polymerase sigma-70 factor (ECF subfamily)